MTMPKLSNKVFLIIAILGILAVSGSALAAPTIKVAGQAKFVLKGTVVSVAQNTVKLHVTNTSKNAKVFDGKDVGVAVGSKTKVTKVGKMISSSEIKAGDQVKAFGIFNKKTNSITLVRWIKVLPQKAP